MLINIIDLIKMWLPILIFPFEMLHNMLLIKILDFVLIHMKKIFNIALPSNMYTGSDIFITLCPFDKFAPIFVIYHDNTFLCLSAIDISSNNNPSYFGFFHILYLLNLDSLYYI